MGKKKLKISKSTKVKKGDVPALVKSKGTPVLGVVHFKYIQTEVPEKYARDTCDALAKALLTDYHKAFCNPNGSDDDSY